MFGYVNINKLELKVREYYQYKGYYCGLCHSLKKHYGQISRMTLNYDMTFLIILLTSLYEVENEVTLARCMVHPTNKQKVIVNSISEYAASMNVLLSYYKCIDNWMDERDAKSIVYAKLLKKAFNKAKKTYPNKAKIIIEQLKKLQRLEKANCEDIDEVSEVFGTLMSELAVYKEDQWASYLRAVGYYLGKYIYLLDAYDDLEEDIKKERYNPLMTYNKNDLDDFIDQLLILQLANLEKEIDKLPLVNEKGILDNILYSGILIHYKNKRRQKENFHERPL